MDRDLEEEPLTSGGLCASGGGWAWNDKLRSHHLQTLGRPRGWVRFLGTEALPPLNTRGWEESRGPGKVEEAAGEVGRSWSRCWAAG